MTDKEIFIDGIKYFKQSDINKGLDEEEQLKRKEQEYEKLNNDNRYFVNQIISLESLADKYELALEEIEQTINNFPSKGIQDVPQTQIEYTQYLLSVSETKLKKILGIIDEVKGNNK